jgi:hypothetical protein
VDLAPAAQPKCNEKIERVHGSSMSHLRAILHNRQPSIDLWPMIRVGVIYAHILLPCDSLGGYIPDELSSGNPIETAGHLRVLGPYRVSLLLIRGRILLENFHPVHFLQFVWAMPVMDEVV